MRRVLSVRLIGVAAAVAASMAATAAQAQDVPTSISPLRVEMDHNGVNLSTGKIQIDGPSLGVPAAPNLRFDRVQNAAPHLKGKVQSVGTDGYRQSTYSIHTGGTESFRCMDWDCTSVTESGSTLVEGARQYRQAGSGAVWAFNLKHVLETGPQPSMLYYASAVNYPNGETISYSYNTHVPGDFLNRTYYRPVTVSSNLGYHITISYQGNTFGTNEWSTVQEATLFKTGDPTPLQKLTYSGAAITDLAGRVFTCQGHGCSNVLGANVEGINGILQLHGEATPALQATAHSTGAVVSSVVKDGVAWTYSYTNLRQNLQGGNWWYDKVTITGPDNFSAAYDFEVKDKQNVLKKVTDAIGRATIYTLDGAGRPTNALFPEGNSVGVAYDDKGNLYAKTSYSKPNSGQGTLSETANFDTINCTGVMCYRPSWVRDAMNRQTDFAYNNKGQIVEQTDPADPAGVRKKTYITYETGTLSRRSVVRVCGQGTTCNTPNEIRTEYEYWGSTFLPSLERRIDAARGATTVTTYGYDAAGRPTVVDGPLPGDGDASYIRYDLLGRKTWEIGPAGTGGVRPAKRFFYRDSDDKVTATEEGTVPDGGSFAFSAASRTDLAYDSRRNPAVETVSAGGAARSLVQRSFHDVGRLECEARRMNPGAFGSLPASACTLGAQGNDGPDRITRNLYDNAGQLLTVQKAYGTPLQQNYVGYSYTPNGKQHNVTDANGNVAQLRYDGHDRLARWVFPSKTAAGQLNEGDYESYGYDGAGNRTALRKRDGTTITYGYDNLNRATVKNVPQSASGAPGYSVHYGYDVQGLQSFARFGSASGPGVSSDYDGFGRPLSSTSTMSGSARTLAYQYDAGGRRSRLTFPDGNYLSYEYDNAGKLTLIRENGGTAVAAFSYDGLGRRTGGSATGTASSYAYDAVSRLETLSHDLAGTGADQSLGFGYNPASQIVSRTSANDGYASNTAYNVSRAYAVNGLNHIPPPARRALAMTRTATSPPTVRRASSTMPRTAWSPPRARRAPACPGTRSGGCSRARAARRGRPSSSTTATSWWRNMTARRPAAPLRPRRRRRRSGVWYEGSGLSDRRSLHADHQGSVVAVADAGGTALKANAYDAWGIPNADNLGRFQYTGQAWVPELGMYHYKARIYSPTLGRFLQTDPIGYDDQVNLYAYVGNDPLNGRDPTGTEGIASDLANWGKMVASDIADLGRGLARGDFAWALGGMPPTLAEYCRRGHNCNGQSVSGLGSSCFVQSSGCRAQRGRFSHSKDDQSWRASRADRKSRRKGEGYIAHPSEGVQT
jgi:RHS repeat-associated protein